MGRGGMAICSVIPASHDLALHPVAPATLNVFVPAASSGASLSSCLSIPLSLRSPQLSVLCHAGTLP